MNWKQGEMQVATSTGGEGATAMSDDEAGDRGGSL